MGIATEPMGLTKDITPFADVLVAESFYNVTHMLSHNHVSRSLLFQCYGSPVDYVLSGTNYPHSSDFEDIRSQLPSFLEEPDHVAYW